MPDPYATRVCVNVLRPVRSVRRHCGRRVVHEGVSAGQGFGLVALPAQHPVHAHRPRTAGIGARCEGARFYDRFPGRRNGTVGVPPVSSMGIVTACAGKTGCRIRTAGGSRIHTVGAVMKIHGHDIVPVSISETVFERLADGGDPGIRLLEPSEIPAGRELLRRDPGQELGIGRADMIRGGTAVARMLVAVQAYGTGVRLPQEVSLRRRLAIDRGALI